jgi:hypothetical protein
LRKDRPLLLDVGVDGSVVLRFMLEDRRLELEERRCDLGDSLRRRLDCLEDGSCSLLGDKVKSVASVVLVDVEA